MGDDVKKKDVKFDRCIQVPNDERVYLVRDKLMCRILVDDWKEYIALGRPAITVVTQKYANRLKTVSDFDSLEEVEVAKPRRKKSNVKETSVVSAAPKSSKPKDTSTKLGSAELSSAGSSVLVVIPTLNRPVMCRRAIESLLQQEFTNWTLVIAKNGGSLLDARYMRALSDVFDHPQITYLVLPERGLGYALNGGVALLEDHTYFSILEDDDEWHPKFLAHLVAKGDSTGADVIHCRQKQVPRSYQTNSGPMIHRVMAGHNTINFPMCLFRADLVERVGSFCNEAGPACDWDWHLRCINAGAKYVFVPTQLVTHFWHGHNYCLTHNSVDFIKARQREGVYGKCK